MSHFVLAVGALFAAAFLLNLPFGWLRAGARRLSLRWFLYIHLPIPLLFLLRFGLGLSFWVIPLSLAAAVLGQVWGGRLRPDRPAPQPAGAETCDGGAACALAAAPEQS